jgi:hypothetical protein
MAKSTNEALKSGNSGNADNSGLSGSVIAEAGKQGTADQGAVKHLQDMLQGAQQGNAASPVNDAGELKKSAETPAQTAGAQQPIQEPKPATSHEQGSQKMPGQPFDIPQYLRVNPVTNQQEIDAIATFLENYRKAGASETTKKAAPQQQAAQDDEDVLNLHNKRLQEFGAGYVVANRAGVEQVFTAHTWQRLGGDKNTDGWRRVVQTPPEVKALQGKQ